MDENKEPIAERPSEFWNKVYVAVVINTFVIVTAIWAFSRYFK